MQKPIKAKSTETVSCDECKEEFTHRQIKNDLVRFYKVRSGKTLCECCYDDYTEKFENYR